jgi:hypothetical protein
MLLTSMSFLQYIEQEYYLYQKHEHILQQVQFHMVLYIQEGPHGLSSSIKFNLERYFIWQDDKTMFLDIYYLSLVFSWHKSKY